MSDSRQGHEGGRSCFSSLGSAGLEKPYAGRRSFLRACSSSFLPPAVALAAQITYASGTNGVGGTFATSGEAVRGYNQVWHQAGRSWWVWYLRGSTQTGLVFNSSNPTKYNGGSGTVAYAKCSNSNDDSGVTWTCQTTN